MRAHATQIWPADGTLSAVNPHAAQAGLRSPVDVPGAYALSNLLTMPLLRQEFYQLGQGTPQESLLGQL